METEHKLLFEVAPSPYNLPGGVEHALYRVGTCHGQWGFTQDSFFILSVMNEQPGNGHFNDVLQWFENSCKRENKNLLILDCMNKDFYIHLLNKRGFTKLDKEERNLIKIFNKNLYRRLLRKGNEILEKQTLKTI